MLIVGLLIGLKILEFSGILTKKKREKILRIMDRRKLMLKSSLHKTLQPASQSLNRFDSDKNEQTSSRTSRANSLTTSQEKINTVDVERVSSVESSVLKPLNSQSSVKSNSAVESRKRGFCEIEKDVSEKEEFVVSRNSSKIKASSSKLSSQTSVGSKLSVTSQRENFMSSSNVSRTSKPANTTNLSMDKSMTRKRKATSPSLIDSDSDLDLSSDERTVVKRKRDDTMLDTSTQSISRDINSNDSPAKVPSLGHRSPIKPITKSNISQRKDKLKKDKPKELHSYAESEKYRTNKKKQSPKKSNFCMPSVLSNFLQKCGIELSTNGMHILSKLLCIKCLFSTFY